MFNDSEIKKVIVVSLIIGLVGIVISFTPLNNILVPIPNRWGGGYNNVSLPTSVMVLGFGVAGAFITIYFRKKEHNQLNN